TVTRIRSSSAKPCDASQCLRRSIQSAIDATSSRSSSSRVFHIATCSSTMSSHPSGSPLRRCSIRAVDHAERPSCQEEQIRPVVTERQTRIAPHDDLILAVVSGELIGRPVNVVLNPAQQGRFAALAGVDADALDVNVTGWNKYVLLDTDRVFL